MQSITITGRMGNDAEVRQAGDSNVCTWSVAVDQGFGDRKTTNWYRAEVWGKRSDFASRAMKGDVVTVQGELIIDEYNGKPQYKVRANEFTFTTPGKRDDAPRQQQRSEYAVSSRSRSSAVDEFDDGSDIPF